MTACLTVAAAVVVVTLSLVVVVAVDSVVLSLLRSFIRLHSLLHVKSQLVAVGIGPSDVLKDIVQ